jgi:hypothetical protein
MYIQCTFIVHSNVETTTTRTGALYEPPTGKTQGRAAKTSNYIALVCCPSFRFARRRLIKKVQNDLKSQGVRSSRQFPHVHNLVSSLIPCEETKMCKGRNCLARIVFHVSHYEGGNGLSGSVFHKNLWFLLLIV